MVLLGRYSAAGHDSVVVTVVWLPAATMLLLLLVGQWNHVGWSQGLLVVVAGRDTRMMMVSVVVDPWSLGRHTRRWHARQMR